MQVVFYYFVGVAGFELATPWSQTRYTNRTVLHPEIFYQRNKRTCDPPVVNGIQ